MNEWPLTAIASSIGDCRECPTKLPRDYNGRSTKTSQCFECPSLVSVGPFNAEWTLVPANSQMLKKPSIEAVPSRLAIHLGNILPIWEMPSAKRNAEIERSIAVGTLTGAASFGADRDGRPDKAVVDDDLSGCRWLRGNMMTYARFVSCAELKHQLIRRITVSAPENLTDLYTGELQDLWSANDQMAKVLKKMATKVSDPKLKEMFAKSQEGIAAHTDILKELLEKSDEKVKKEHCKGMEGLVAEATKHTTEEAPEKGPVLDAVIIAQYQRMTHYGIAGFGTAASYAGTLGLKDAVKVLDNATKEIYGGDEYMTKLAETSVNIDAKDD